MDKLEVSGVYKIMCLVNGKFYIGSSKNIQKRWYEHWDEKERAITKNTHKNRVNKNEVII